MHTENYIIMHADPGKIFETAAGIEEWPKILPHYRWVKILQRKGKTTLAEMAAKRTGFPVKWTSIQELHPEQGRIIYRHIRGITRGMYVEWNIIPKPDGVHVSIIHELKYPIPVLGDLFGQFIVGRIFVEPIAGRTLACIRRLLESQTEDTV